MPRPRHATDSSSLSISTYICLDPPQAQLSINFIDFIVAPYFVALTSLAPRVRRCVRYLARNRARWVEMRETEIRDAAAKEPSREQLADGDDDAYADESEYLSAAAEDREDRAAKAEEEIAKLKIRNDAFAASVAPILERDVDDDVMKALLLEVDSLVMT